VGFISGKEALFLEKKKRLFLEKRSGFFAKKEAKKKGGVSFLTEITKFS
jgi:hypothetical protein